MTLFLVSYPECRFYHCGGFDHVIAYMMAHTRRCDLKEQNGRRSVIIKEVPTVAEGVSVLQEMIVVESKN